MNWKLICLSFGAVITITLATVQAQEKKTIPFQGDETTLTRIKVAPDEFVGEVFVLCGGIRLDDYFNYNYDKATSSHYSLRFSQAGKDSKPTRDQAHLYLSRKLGEALIDKLVEREETKGPGNLPLARVTVSLLKSRFDPDGWNMFEVLEVQFPNDDWSDWEDGVIREAMKPKMRTWTDSSGVHETLAKFKDYKDGFVLLELESGKERSIKADTLSEADIEYIKERLRLGLH